MGMIQLSIFVNLSAKIQKSEQNAKGKVDFIAELRKKL